MYFFVYFVCLKDEHFIVPLSPDQWQRVTSKFSQRWNFHHCCSTLDGKHIKIKKPDKSRSNYFNYIGYFSLILLALVDTDYKFIWCNTGEPVRPLMPGCSTLHVFARPRRTTRWAYRTSILCLAMTDPFPILWSETMCSRLEHG